MIPGRSRRGAALLAAPLLAVALLAGSLAGARAGEPAGATPATSRPADRPALRRYTLAALVDRARHSYPGVKAAEHALAAMQQQLFRARWAWVPRGRVKGLLTFSPNISCLPSPENCQRTDNVDLDAFILGGVYGKIEIELGMPLYTFGKISAAKAAAEAGVAVRREQIGAAQEDIALKVTRAYWGLKLAREIIFTIDEGKPHLDKARKRIEEDLETGEGESTLTDLLRLKTLSSEVETRTFAARKLERLARDALAVLTGLGRQPFDLDDVVLDPIDRDLRPLDHYLTAARGRRPEVRLLELAVKARQAKADLERAKFFPDFLLVGGFGYAGATSADDPQNAFFNDPYNFLGAGVALSLRWNLDPVQQVGRYRAARAAADEMDARRREGMLGIQMDIRKAYRDLAEARQRLDAARRGQKNARRWLISISQNIDAGLAEPKELNDALLAFFQMRLKYLQAIFDVNYGWARLSRAAGAPLASLAAPGAGKE